MKESSQSIGNYPWFLSWSPFRLKLFWCFANVKSIALAQAGAIWNFASPVSRRCCVHWRRFRPRLGSQHRWRRWKWRNPAWRCSKCCRCCNLGYGQKLRCKILNSMVNHKLVWFNENHGDIQIPLNRDYVIVLMSLNLPQWNIVLKVAVWIFMTGHRSEVLWKLHGETWMYVCAWEG